MQGQLYRPLVEDAIELLGRGQPGALSGRSSSSTASTCLSMVKILHAGTLAAYEGVAKAYSLILPAAGGSHALKPDCMILSPSLMSAILSSPYLSPDPACVPEFWLFAWVSLFELSIWAKKFITAWAGRPVNQG